MNAIDQNAAAALMQSASPAVAGAGSNHQTPVYSYAELMKNKTPMTQQQPQGPPILNPYQQLQTLR